VADDEEQVEELKKWWSENGKSLVAGLGIGLAAVIGWTSWQTWERTQAELASVRYEQLVNDASAEKHDQALSQAEALADEFPDSAYASLASLIAARAAVQANDPDKAKQHLEWVVDHTPFPELVPVARLRFARLLIDAREYDGALAELGRIDSALFHGRVKELQGDIHHARGDSAAARESYETVLADAELSPSTHARVRMKLDDLGEFTFPPSS
jgi:predicted negative regulator of RcsB-dependent stress response